MTSSPAHPLTLLSSLFCAVALFCVGCQSTVGDTCASNLECNRQDSAICDVSVPDGYCTVANCVPNGCPAEAVCVRFDEVTSYCMKVCLSSDDCRKEHVCRDVGTYGSPGYGFCYIAPQS